MLKTLIGDVSSNDPSLALCTDQYELTMALAYWNQGMAGREAVFHMFFRSNPFGGGYVVMAGLATLIEALRGFHFSTGDLDYLATLNDRTGQRLFPEPFLRYLEEMKFVCDVDAAPEGTIVFPNEPLARVRGPILQAQLLESLLLNILNFQSLIATKAARVCLAAQGDPVIDFGLRRAQGVDGALSASRASYVGGCVGTSNVLAGKLLDIPVYGTHAHSWVMAFEDEAEAFRAFARAMPGNCVFLVDTYGTLSGLRNAVVVGRELRGQGHRMVGVRLDSGDLAYFSKKARTMLDQAGLEDALVMGSNELDEYVIRSLKAQGAKINAWGVGTKLVTAQGDPALSGVYKLTAIRGGEDGQWQYRLKLSEQKFKISIPGILQAYRYFNGEGKMNADAILNEGEDPAKVESIIDPIDNTHRKQFRASTHFEPLLQPVFRQGRQVLDVPPLPESRERTQAQLKLLDDSHKRLENPHIYPVGLSASLNSLRDDMITRERDRLNSGG